MKFTGNVTFKLLIFIFILSGTLSYSFYLKKSFSNLEEHNLKPILKIIPDIEIVDSLTKKKINLKKESIENQNGSFVHFWGTWCGPCEEELPSFIELSKKFQKSGETFFLVAVNDNKKDLKKFLKRFKSLPTNIKILLDNSGTLMSSFGVVKVPETFIFDNKGRSLKKFSGPQDWSYSYYFKTINDLFRDS
tara:strand:- start:365 stop:937 length:573 start_codon:yes stop_codon:yes gene_type:complete